MPSFRTKRGVCRLNDGTLSLESSIAGQLRRYWEGNRLIFISYLVLILVGVGFVGELLLTGQFRTLAYWTGAVVAIVGGAYAVNYARGFTRDEEIPVEDIVGVRAVEGSKGLTRPRFVVRYRQNEDINRRYVMMPSKWLYGETEFDNAKEAFEEVGVQVEE